MNTKERNEITKYLKDRIYMIQEEFKFRYALDFKDKDFLDSPTYYIYFGQIKALRNLLYELTGELEHLKDQ
jgi:hypothetical protein